MQRVPTGATAIFFAGFVSLSSLAGAANGSQPNGHSSRIEEYMAARVARDKFSGTVLLARDGEVIFCQGYGMANLEHNAPCSPQTKFRLASLTKQFTAMAILILKNQGKLDVGDEIKKYVPNAPKSWDGITVHHLLTHTSGIPNMTSFPEFKKMMRDRVSVDELIGKFKDKPLDFKPGEKFKYSNSGYIVLGKIIETASGESYEAYLKEAIFEPLQMHDSGYDNPTYVLKNRAAGYVRLPGLNLANSQYFDMSIPYSAGGLFSTVSDLLKWDQALETEKLVPKSLINAMFTPFKEGYAYGWGVDTNFGRSRSRHGGSIPGFASYIVRFPSEKLLVVVLSNVEGMRAERIGDDLAAILLDLPYVVPREPRMVKLDSHACESYSGIYEGELADSKGKREFTVTAAEGRLTIEPKGQPRVQAIPESETRFYLKEVDGLAEFVRATNGSAPAIEFLLGNQKLKAIRVRDIPKRPDGPQTKPNGAEGASLKSGKLVAPDPKP
jgi:CubicO group peptidase (beta-lactamase class C family)